jgi:hypothetical protein
MTTQQMHYILSNDLEIPDLVDQKIEEILFRIEAKTEKTANVKHKSRMRPMYRRPAVLAAAVAIAVLMFSTAALAYTGVLSGFFLAITGNPNASGGIVNDSRLAIMEHGYVADAWQDTPVSIDGNSLELKAYYADEKEIGFNFVLSGPDLPDDVSSLFIGYLSMTMTYSNGDISSWEHVYDQSEELEVEGDVRVNHVEKRIFPGGFFHYDRLREINVYEYEPGGGYDFYVNASAVRIDEDSYDIAVIITFYSLEHDAKVPVGESVQLEIGNLIFYPFTDRERETAVQEKTLNGIWKFDFIIENIFTDTMELVYNVVNKDELAQQGVTIKSVTILPSVSRIEATIDFSKNSLARPGNALMEWVLEDPSDPMRLAKFDMMDVSVYAVSETGLYGNMLSSHTEANGRIVECWFEISSMFFDAPENLTLYFEGRGGAVIQIQLKLGN